MAINFMLTVDRLFKDGILDIKHKDAWLAIHSAVATDQYIPSDLSPEDARASYAQGLITFGMAEKEMKAWLKRTA